MAALGLSLDLWSKDWAFRTLDYHSTRVLLPRVLEFQTVLNPGALFGIGAGYTSVFLVASMLALGLVFWMFAHSGRNRWLLHIALGGILAGALGNMYDRINVRLVRPVENSPRYWTMHPQPDGTVRLVEFHGTARRSGPDWHPRERTLSAEAASELPRPTGFVRDFIKIPTTFRGRELWPWVFNVADMLLVGGVCILALGLITERDRGGAPSRLGRQSAAAEPAPSIWAASRPASPASAGESIAQAAATVPGIGSGRAGRAPGANAGFPASSIDASAGET